MVNGRFKLIINRLSYMPRKMRDEKKTLVTKLLELYESFLKIQKTNSGRPTLQETQ